jgi:hypothetical protein
LGYFYNEVHHEIAQAHVTLRSSCKTGGLQHVRAAIDAFEPFENVEILDPFLCFKRDLVKAHITSARGNFEQAIAEYEMALRSLEIANEGEDPRRGCRDLDGSGT